MMDEPRAQVKLSNGWWREEGMSVATPSRPAIIQMVPAIHEITIIEWIVTVPT